MIPKIIHYCWFGPNPFPKLVKECMETWNKHLPDYEFRLWNEKNSPMHVPFVQQAYSAKKYAFVSDYMRFWALHNHGGIYLDTDVYVNKSFNKLLDTDFLIGWENLEKTMLGFCVFGSLANHPLLASALNVYKNVSFKVESFENLIIPRLLTPIFLHNNSFKQKSVLDYDFFYPLPFDHKNKRNFMSYTTPNTYAIHLWNLSWISWKRKQRDRILSKVLRILKFLRLWK